MSHSTHPAASRRLLSVKQHLSEAVALAACLALAALAAACGLATAPANRQTNGDAARQSSLAPAAPTPTPAPKAVPGVQSGKVESPLPAPTGFVNDYAKVLDDEARARLEQKLLLLQERGKVDFAVVTIGTTGGHDIEDYSLAVARGWGIGSQETGDGLLLMIAIEDRKWQVRVSRSLEPTLSNAAVKEICRSAVSLYGEGRYAEGITRCVDGLTARLIEKKRFKVDE